MLIYLILEENNIYRKSSHFFYEGKLPSLTIKLFDDMKVTKKEKFAQFGFKLKQRGIKLLYLLISGYRFTSVFF